MQQRSFLCQLDLQLINDLHLNPHLCRMFIIQQMHKIQMPDERVDVIAEHIAVRPFAESVLIKTTQGAQKLSIFIVTVTVLVTPLAVMAMPVVVVGGQH